MNEEDGCMTVETLRQSIIAAENEEAEQDLINKGKEAALEAVKFLFGAVPFGAIIFKAAQEALSHGEFMKDMYDIIKGKPLQQDTIDQFPILQKLKMDSELIKTIDDDIVKNIDDQYETYLETLDPNTCVEKIADINEFTRNFIAQQTDKHVVINDLSGDGG